MPTITSRGVCWSKNPTPTTNNNKTIDGSGIGAFTSSLSGLTANTLYYVRAYAINSVGTAYGDEISFTTSQSYEVPKLVTVNANSITQTYAVAGGMVTNEGGTSVISRGSGMERFAKSNDRFKHKNKQRRWYRSVFKLFDRIKSKHNLFLQSLWY